MSSFFGVIKIGGVAIGMSTTLTPPEYAYMLDDSRARVLVVHETLVGKVADIVAERPFLKHVIVIGLGVVTQKHRHILDQYALVGGRVAITPLL